MSYPPQESTPDSSPKLVHRTAFTVIGPFIRTTNAAEMSAEGKIGPLWERFMQAGQYNIPAVIDNEFIYAVYTCYESTETGSYDLILGKSVERNQQAPAHTTSIALPATRYLVFPTHGSSPDAIKTAWMNVYRYFSEHSQHRRAFTSDFEQHSLRETKIFIAVR